MDYENTPINEIKLKEVTDYFIFEKISSFRILFNLIISPFRKIPIQVSFFYSSKIKTEINKIINDFKPDIVFAQLIRTAEYIIDNNTVPKVLDYVDVISEGLNRRKKESNFIMRFFLDIEYKRVINYERKTFNSFNKKIIITNEDKKYFPVENKEHLYVIPNGVDTDFFKPITGLQKEYDILFTGNMKYPPNVLAAEFIVKKILPILKVNYPEIKVLIVGASPSQKILSLSSTNVEILGWVDDIRMYYSKAKVFVAPLKIGTGLQNKLLEAMSMELPSISTELVQKAIKAPVNETLFVAGTAEEFAESVCNLLENYKLAEEVGKKAREFVKNNYNWDIVGIKLNELLNE